jgi:uncharacterized protein (TIGR00369 family)
MTESQPRSRTFEWTDPAIVAAHLGAGSGLDLLKAMESGDVPPPPVMQLIGMDALRVTDTGVVVEMEPAEFHYNPLGTIHGGVLAILLDTAAACSVHATLPVGFGYTTLDLTTKYLRPATIRSGRLRCTGTVLSRGRRTALAEARLTDARDRLIAHAASSCLIFPVDEGAQSPPGK